MRSRAHILGHPLHPMLVVFPLALLPVGVLFDALGFWTGDTFWHAAAFWMFTLGVVGAILASIPGLVDYAFIVRNTSAERTGTLHMIFGFLTIAVFAIAAGLHWPPGNVPFGGGLLAAIVEGVGILLLVAQGWWGGELVYRHRRGVTERGEETEAGRAGRPARGERPL
ncbi:MAG TPA: DUF2231 domain-containing protein [Candidatus Thermoplasmatota archaeon]|nr:DUF2231 domain-containing protein [Candidatus Thermoplasmatota archaeon]